MSYAYLQEYPNIRISRSGFDVSQKQKFERHCHSNYELIYIIEGEGKYIVEGVEYPLHPHALLLMRPYEYHYVCPAGSQNYERVVINFEPELLPIALREHHMLKGTYGNYFSLKSINNPIRAAYEILDSVIPLSNGGFEKNDKAEAFLQATVLQILLLLTQETPEKTISAESDTVLRIIEYLNRHLFEEISLETVAHEFFISKYHLCRIFHQQTGASIFTYFNTKRMAQAQQMIANGESATSVAFKLGFRDYSTFYRAYRKQFGKSPVRKYNEKAGAVQI